MIIYKIINTITSDFYIGKTINSVDIRFKQHYYRKNSKSHLHRAMQKYGIDNFTVTILEETTLDLLNERERFWISKLKPQYNMTSGGDGGDTSKSENYKKAMLLVHSKKKPEDYASYGMKGKKQSSKFLSSIKKSNCCPVMCDGVEYPSVGEAERAYPGIKIRYRLDNPKFPNFYRLREKTSR